jgi:hypothetical protein
MKLEGKYRVPAPRPQVWTVLQDANLLARVLPGCEKLETVGENKYSAVVKIQVGPLQGTFSGTILLGDMVAPESYTMDFDGKGALGFVKGKGAVRLVEVEGATDVHYTGDASIGGRIASVGQRLMETSARALIEQTFDLLTPIAQSLVPPPAAGDVASAPVAPVVPPDLPIQRQSQIAFGLGVLRHMYEDAVPPTYRTPLLVGAGVVGLLIVWAVVSAIFGR